jgi:DNA repair exonuclease SbcCD nuclease subunit
MHFRFLHAADLHLDTPFSGLYRIDPALAETMQGATTRAFANLVEAAIEKRVSFVLIAGDVYDGPERGLRAQLAFRDGLKRLSDAGIQTFIAHGNHDPVDEGWSAVREWPERVTVFDAGQVQSFPVERDGETIAVVHGISYPQRAVTENLSRRIRRTPPACLQVGVLHCNVGTNGDHALYSPCSVDDLVDAGLDYWALGHVHMRQVLRSGDPWIAYPGNTQGLGLRVTERGPKGALLVDVEGGRVLRTEFLPLDVVRFSHVSVDISDIGDVAGLRDAMVDAAREQAEVNQGRASVIRFELAGRGQLHAELARGRTSEQLVEQVRSALLASAPPVWVDGIDNDTHAAIDLATIEERGDFASDLVGTAKKAAAAPGDLLALLGACYRDLPTTELRRLLGQEVETLPGEEDLAKGLELALDALAESQS